MENMNIIESFLSDLMFVTKIDNKQSTERRAYAGVASGVLFIADIVQYFHEWHPYDKSSKSSTICRWYYVLRIESKRQLRKIPNPKANKFSFVLVHKVAP